MLFMNTVILSAFYGIFSLLGDFVTFLKLCNCQGKGAGLPVGKGYFKITDRYYQVT